MPKTITTGATVDLNAVELKHGVRTRIRSERQSRSTEQRLLDAESLATVVLDLPDVQVGRCVALYASLPSEPGTTPLREQLRQIGVRTLLPVSLGGGRLDWAYDEGALRPTRGLGGPEPTGKRLGSSAIQQADVVLVPALAVDTLGRRLGQGAGYYDRALLLLDAAVPVIAVVHDSEVLDAAVEPVPVEPHDVTVDAVVTPSRCLWLPPRSRG